MATFKSYFRTVSSPINVWWSNAQKYDMQIDYDMIKMFWTMIKVLINIFNSVGYFSMVPSSYTVTNIKAEIFIHLLIYYIYLP